jgi:hypothetical protein
MYSALTLLGTVWFGRGLKHYFPRNKRNNTDVSEARWLIIIAVEKQ